MRIISQIVGINEVCAQNGDKVLKEQQKFIYLQYETRKDF